MRSRAPHRPSRDAAVDVIARERYDAVLFDLDGVLTDTAQIHASSWKRMFDAYLQGRARRTGTW